MRGMHFIVGLVAALLVASGAIADEQSDERLTLVFVGDTGTNASGARVTSEGGYKRGRLLSVPDALETISPWLQGDIVFANLESVVTDRNNISQRNKMFVFRMHPQGARDLLRAGFNAFSTANNHALDFGSIGAGETLRNMEALSQEGLLAWPGLSMDRQSGLRPQVVSLGDRQIAFSAWGIGGGSLPAREGRAGALRGDDDLAALSEELGRTDADLRILSVHYGQEFVPSPSNTEIQRLRGRANVGGELSIVAGHHAHVARGIEVSNRHLVIYGLGNFLHFGTQNMARFDICRDFGLLVRVGLRDDAAGDLTIDTVEAVPLKNMHVKTEPMRGEDASLRVQVLSYLGSKLDNEDAAARGLRFAQQENGAGLWCAEGATDARCVDWVEPALASGRVGRQIDAACSRDVRRGNL